LDKVVVWGTSGHASVVTDILELQNKYHIHGYLDDIYIDRHGTLFCGKKILGGKEQLDILRQSGVEHIILGFGNNEARMLLAKKVEDMGFTLISAIHPTSVIANTATIKEGSVICANSVINPNSVIGRNVIINTSASVDHDCLIEDGVHICPGVLIAGKVTIHRGAWIGIGATVIENISVGKGSIIGAGSVVVHDIPEGVIAHGVPARVVKEVDR
jgi:UDP-N-acetylbacillosamine N-acetyltransferase